MEIFKATDRFGDTVWVQSNAGTAGLSVFIRDKYQGVSTEVELTREQAHELIASLADALGYSELN